MRHRKRRGKLGRTTSHREAMLKNLVCSLLVRQRVRTTVAKAKEGKKVADRVITLAKEGTLSARRKAFGILKDRTLVKETFNEIAPRFKERSGGYTRLIRCAPRPGDGAEMAILELVEQRPLAAKGKRAKKVKPPSETKALQGPQEVEKKEHEPEVPEVRPKGPKFLEGLRKYFRVKPSP